MNNEIKEIIDNLIRFRNEDNKFQPEDILTIEDVWLLLDYITNLQTIEQQYSALLSENAELKEVNNYSKRKLYKINKDRLEANLKLVEENERLKNRNEFLNQVCVGFDDKYEDYKSRCEKLREYINTHQLFKYIYDDEELFEIITDKEAKKDLENILNGGKNE